MTLQISLFEEIPVTDTELCMILGNLLENAVEACRRMSSPERFIDLELSMISSTLLVIMIRNSYEGTIQRTQDGTFFSVKAENRRGIGISSVLSIAEKYNGISKFEYTEQIFQVSLMLNGREIS